MGRPAEEGEDNRFWDEAGDKNIQKLSSSLDARKPGLLQRIERQRAAYFADVEDGHDAEDLEDEDGDERVVNKPHGREDNADAADAPSSSFADLSTWCCDARLPAGSPLASAEKRPAWLISVMDQPTLVLSIVASASMQIADLSTLPLLPAVHPVRDGFAPGRLVLLIGGQARGVFICWRRSLLHLWLHSIHCAARLRKIRRPALNGHEMLMERLRAREQRNAVPPALLVPSDARPVRQFRLPADSLFD